MSEAKADKTEKAPLSENLRARAAEIGEAAREGAERAYESLKHQTEDGIDHAHLYLRRQWRERPLAVAATAVGVGLILGMLISGKRH